MRQRDSKGVALILVLTVVAILTTGAVDFSYNSRVNLHLAANARDELRAYYQARSALNYARLLLHFQKQIDGVAQQTAQALGQAAAQMSSLANMNIRLWELLPIDSGSLSLVLGELNTTEGSKDQEAPNEEGQPESDAMFEAKITAEDTKINVNRLEGIGGANFATLQALGAMMQDPKYDFLFDTEDENGDRVDRREVIIAMKDWIDPDEQQSTLDPSNLVNPFPPGFLDENGPYQRYRDRYKAKNAKLDSTDELYLVHGIGDRFMSIFGEQLTVYPDIGRPLILNVDDPRAVLVDMLVAARNPNDLALLDLTLFESILDDLKLAKTFNIFGVDVATFARILVSHGVQVKPELTTPNSPNAPLGSQSEVFRVEAIGRAGDVEKKLTAIVKYDDKLGELRYWREE